jgi:flagellar biosynthetic protein FliR
MDFGPLARLGLLLVRPGMLVMAAPAFGGTYSPARVRIGLTLILAVALMPFVPSLPPATLGALAVVVVRELAIGLALALAIRALVAGAELGGHLAGAQLMLSYGSVVDPQGGVRNNILANMYGNLALLTFFATNGHHAFLRGLAASYSAMPIGIGHVDQSLGRAITEFLGLVFVLGLRLAAPVVAVMLVVELAMGLVARSAPAINVTVVAGPIRLVVGLLAVAAAVAFVPGLVARFASIAADLGFHSARAFR